MGRKIPGKKHHGVKDPVLQRIKRELSLKDKINAPPSNPDVQEIPKSVLEMNRLRQLAKQYTQKLKQKKGGKGTVNQVRNVASEPLLQEHLGRKISARKHLSVKDPVQQRIKKNISLKDKINALPTNPYVQVIPKGKAKENIQKFKQKKATVHDLRNKGSGQLAQGGSLKTRLGKKQRQKVKKAPKKLEQEFEAMETQYDHVKFGEVAHGPPNLKKIPRGATRNSSVGAKGLLLTNMLDGKKSIGMAEKKRLEQQRLDVVEAYRRMKAARYLKPS